MRKWLAWAAAAGLVPALIVLHQVPPTKGSFYPPCLFHACTGLHCPGCGAARCLHALLHGQLRQAAAYNLLFLLALPILLFSALRVWYAALTGRSLRPRLLPRWLVGLLVGALFAYGIMRNLPVAPFNLLAPHRVSTVPAPPPRSGLLLERIALGVSHLIGGDHDDVDEAPDATASTRQ